MSGADWIRQQLGKAPVVTEKQWRGIVKILQGKHPQLKDH